MGRRLSSGGCPLSFGCFHGFYDLVPFLAPSLVFERTRTIWGEFADAVVAKSGQCCDMTTGAVKAHTFLLSETLLVGGEGGACTARMRLLLDKSPVVVTFYEQPAVS